MTKIVWKSPKHRTIRLRARRIDENDLAERARELALKKDDWVYLVDHGGGVANSYRYTAETECALAVANPAGVAVVWVCRAPATNITERRAANTCIMGAGYAWDARVTRSAKINFSESIMRKRFEGEVGLLDQIGAIGGD